MGVFELMKYKILGVAPYEALNKMMENIAASIDDVEYHGFVGDLEEGVRIVKEHEKDGFDAIISRGGTAQMIARVTQLPVIYISMSVYDIIRAMKLANNYQEAYAIVGFENITETAHLLCDLIENRKEIVTIHDEAEAKDVLAGLKARGIRMVICDMVTQHTANLLEMNSILITSGTESILTAFHNATEICRRFVSIQEENRFLRSILKDNGSSTIVMEEDGTIYLSTWDETAENADVFLKTLRKEVQVVLRENDRKFFRTIDKVLYSVNARKLFYKDKKYVVFYFTASKIPLATGKYGIHFNDKQEIDEEYYNSFYSIAGAMGLLNEKIEEICKSKYPVMILSEEGTGKKLIAGRIYAKSSLSDHPLITIDCGIMDDRGWEYLLNHYNSPFNDNDNTIYFENADKIPKDKHRRLLSSILDTNLQRRNRLIFSAVDSNDATVRQQIEDYRKKLYCVNIGLPALSTRTEEIPLLASFYLSRLNMDLGREIIGLEPGAIALLEQYSWPQNYRQFQRILVEAASETTTSYIRTGTIAELLEKERATTSYQMLMSEMSDKTFPHMTLEQITKNIVEQILKDNGGNQSKTARQLGISRTTLWRYISKKENG